MPASSHPRIPNAPPAPSSSSAPRAKHLSPSGRTERPCSEAERHTGYQYAEVFDMACRESGLTNEEIAKYCNVDEKIVRGLRTGARVVTLPRLGRCPIEIRARVLKALLAELMGPSG
jgi:ribosome-binding protein aMBF1 (putative translation factor)